MRRLVICIDNAGYGVSLELRKIYVCLSDATAERRGQLHIIDESGEGYLYPKRAFVTAELPPAVRRAVLRAT